MTDAAPSDAPPTEEGAPVGTDAEFVVLYHGPVKFKGRAEFLRVMLEDKGADYSHSAAGLYGPMGSMDAFRGSPEAVAATDDVAFPTFFPPAIWHRPADGGEEVLINQVLGHTLTACTNIAHAHSR